MTDIRRSHLRRRRSGFTMLEILIAIGIVLLLMGIGVLGYRAYDKNASTNATNTALENGMALLTEWEAAGKQANDLAVYAVGSTSAITNAGDVNAGGGYRSTAITNGQRTLEWLTRIPKNKDAIAAFSPKAFVNEAGVRRQVLADGWGNPIILVGGSGIRTRIASNSQTPTITAPGNRPFFVSAGPDGDLSTEDDNIYSFKKQ